MAVVEARGQEKSDRPAYWSSASACLAPPGASDPQSENDDKEGGEVSRQTPRRILIVEDEMIAALAARELLRTAGYDVVDIVASAAEAVRKAGETRPDLVLMDIRLRGHGDGIAAATEIRQRFDLPSLFVSAHETPDIRARAVNARPVGFVVKPYGPAELLAAIRRAFRS